MRSILLVFESPRYSLFKPPQKKKTEISARVQVHAFQEARRHSCMSVLSFPYYTLAPPIPLRNHNCGTFSPNQRAKRDASNPITAKGPPSPIGAYWDRIACSSNFYSIVLLRSPGSRRSPRKTLSVDPVDAYRRVLFDGDRSPLLYARIKSVIPAILP